MWSASETAPAAASQAAGAGSAGVSQLSDMHARWREKGAHDFVPSNQAHDFLPSNQGVVKPAFSSVGQGGIDTARGRVPLPAKARGGYMNMHPAQMAAAAAWGSGMRMPMPWEAMANGSPPADAQWPGGGTAMPGVPFGPGYGSASPGGHGSGMHLSGFQSPQDLREGEVAVPSKPNTVVVAWNLSPSYTPEELESSLLEYDFHPRICRDLADGAFVLEFAEVWQANALIVSLDDTEEYLAPVKGERLRLAMWGVDTPGWGASAKEVPSSLQQALPPVLQPM